MSYFESAPEAHAEYAESARYGTDPGTNQLHLDDRDLTAGTYASWSTSGSRRTNGRGTVLPSLTTDALRFDPP
jgi:hypothetical protein